MLLQQHSRQSGVAQPGARGQVDRLGLVRGASEAIVSGAVTLLVLCAAASSPSVIGITPSHQPSAQDQGSGPGQPSAGPR